MQKHLISHRTLFMEMKTAYWVGVIGASARGEILLSPLQEIRC